VHGVPMLHHMQEGITTWAATAPGGAVLGTVLSTLFDAVVGLVVGALVVAVVTGATRMFKRKPA
jgi:predicted DNA repair protein MutK